MATICVLFFIFCVVDTIFYIKAPHPQRTWYVSVIPGSGIYAYYKTKNMNG